jgi:hypothetical protein
LSERDFRPHASSSTFTVFEYSGGVSVGCETEAVTAGSGDGTERASGLNDARFSYMGDC